MTTNNKRESRINGVVKAYYFIGGVAGAVAVTMFLSEPVIGWGFGFAAWISALFLIIAVICTLPDSWTAWAACIGEGDDWDDDWDDDEINPATGLPMTGAMDAGGNPYGTD